MKRLRRFDPRFGVSEQMLEAEGIYIGQEFRDHEKLALTALRKMLADRQAKITVAEANLQHVLRNLPDRERLIIRCMMVRDFYHIAALYEQFVRPMDLTGPSKLVPEELTEEEGPIPVMPFTEWLFQQ